jgi:hypothetical protein
MASHVAGAPMIAPGAMTRRSLNTVTVSPRSISGPDPSTTRIRDSSFTLIVAVVSANTCRTATGSPDRVASIRKIRCGCGP